MSASEPPPREPRRARRRVPTGAVALALSLALHAAALSALAAGTWRLPATVARPTVRLQLEYAAQPKGLQELPRIALEWPPPAPPPRVAEPGAEGAAQEPRADEPPDEAPRARWLYEVTAGADRVRPPRAAASAGGEADESDEDAESQPAGTVQGPPAPAGEAAQPEIAQAPAAPAATGGSAVVAPVPLADNPPPAYPAAARRRGEEGLVVVLVHVLADGTAGAVSLAESSGHPRLDEAALAAVAGWRFRPAEREGVAVDHDLEVPLRFVLRGR